MQAAAALDRLCRVELLAPAAPAVRRRRRRRRRAAPPVDMTGRWILTTPNAPTCGMNFGDMPGAQEHDRAGGRLPGQLLHQSELDARRRAALIVNDHEDEALAELTFAGGRFEAKSDAGVPVTLSRSSFPKLGSTCPNISFIASPIPAMPIAPR